MMTLLKDTNPEIFARIDPAKNPGLNLDSLSTFAEKKVVWTYPYDDPTTGKHFDFTWIARVRDTVRHGVNCPFLTNKRAWPGFNDFKTRRSTLAKQWNYAKNGDLDPSTIPPSYREKVWWIYPYDDPRTGKHFDFEWQATVVGRKEDGTDVPFLYNKMVWPGYNDLESYDPKVAAEFHPTKNAPLTAKDFVYGSQQIIWWQVQAPHPFTGEIWTLEWQSRIDHRTKDGEKCPYLSGMAVLRGFNDLGSNFPQFVEEWDNEANGDKTPWNVSFASGYKAHWKKTIVDPVTGKVIEHKWVTSVANRTGKGTGDPYVANKKINADENSFAVAYPALTKEYHPTKNGNLRPDQVAPKSGLKVWWLLPYDDPVTGRHFDFEWQESFVNRANGNGCPFLSGQRVWPKFNDFETKHPEAAKFWHPYKNGDILPSMVTPGSEEKFWWFEAYDDPKTGKHHDFEWKCSIRTLLNRGNPYLKGTELWPDYNSLQAVCPEIATEFDTEKNGIGPDEIMWNSTQVVWWKTKATYPDGSERTISWDMRVNHRTVDGHGCPYLSNHRIDPELNSLLAMYPAVAAEFDTERNEGLTPADLAPGSGKKVWWTKLIPDLNGGLVAVSWKATVIGRTLQGAGCPYENGRLVQKGVNDLESCRPDIVAWWDYDANDISPDSITVASTYKAHWKLDYFDERTGKTFPFRWTEFVHNRTIGGSGCPFLSGKQVWPGFNDLLSHDPEIAADFDYEANAPIRPEDLAYGSGQIVWWKQTVPHPITGETVELRWYSTVANRTVLGNGNPYLSGQKVMKGFNDLESRKPKIAAELHPTKNHGLTADRIYYASKDKIWWRCSEGHEWYAPVVRRVRYGSGCPECRKLRHQNGYYDN